MDNLAKLPRLHCPRLNMVSSAMLLWFTGMACHQAEDTPPRPTAVIAFKALGIDKVILAVEDMNKAVDFYSAVLSVEMYSTEIQGHTLYGAKLKTFEIQLCPRKLAQVDSSINNNTVQVRVVVADVQAAFDEGQRAGGRVVSHVQRVGDSMHASLRDPDGNSVELVQYLH